MTNLVHPLTRRVASGSKLEKQSNQMFDYMEEVQEELDQNEGSRELKRKRDFLVNLASGYTDAEYSFCSNFEGYFNRYTAGLRHYLEICSDFWGEYLMSFDGLKKTNPKWRTN